MAKRASITLLIADDHAEFRKAIRQVLQDVPVACSEASSGNEAVQLFKEQHHDWVILDVRMPDGGGISAAKAIRELEPNARVILISQWNDEECEIAAEEVGAIRFLNKEDVCLLPKIIQSQT